VPTTITATSLSLAAGRDMHLQGTQADVAKDIAIDSDGSGTRFVRFQGMIKTNGSRW
jgi:hypothetical protein